MVREVAVGIAYAHQVGIIHRDLKPANILIDQEGTPLVTDFGLAKFVHDVEGLTRTGQPLGTPSYMSPEQARGEKEVGVAADVYSLGAVLYSALTGRPPFQAASSAGTIIQVVTKDVVAPRSLNSDIDRDLETICLKCLEKDPNQRYGSAVELKDELDRFLNDKPIMARPAGPLERAVKLCRRNPAMAALVAMALGLVAIIGVASTSAAYSKRLEKSLKESNTAKTQALLREQETVEALGLAKEANARAEITEYYQRISVAKMAIDDGDIRAAGDAMAGLKYPDDDSAAPWDCLLYTSPSPRDATLSRMPSSA